MGEVRGPTDQQFGVRKSEYGGGTASLFSTYLVQRSQAFRRRGLLTEYLLSFPLKQKIKESRVSHQSHPKLETFGERR